MSDKTGIQWTDATWNPFVGCSIISPGCRDCYAMEEAARQIRCAKGLDRPTHYEGTVKTVKGKSIWTGNVNLAPDHVLTKPLHWKKPRRIFVNSMSDLFHESVPDEWIIKVLAVIACSPQHAFQILTKRAERMRSFMAKMPEDLSTEVLLVARRDEFGYPITGAAKWPLPNIWLGVSTERQKEADERIPLLLQTPAAVRFISAEPLIDSLSLRWAKWDDWTNPDGTGRQTVNHLDGARMLDWVIVGGESGPRARPMNPRWARELRDQCREAGVPFFFKQWGGRHAKSAGRLLDGKEHSEFPAAPAKARAA